VQDIIIADTLTNTCFGGITVRVVAAVDSFLTPERPQEKWSSREEHNIHFALKIQLNSVP